MSDEPEPVAELRDLLDARETLEDLALKYRRQQRRRGSDSETGGTHA